jgi:O-antigen/teichoic acid export membrane protein
MSALTDLLRNSLSYFFGRMAVLLAGLISLPLMTRLLPKEDYGLMSLVFLALTITTALSGLGFSQSTTRYFAEYAGRGRQALMKFCSTMTIGTAVAGAAAMLVLFLASFALAKTSSFADVAVHLRYALALVILRLISSVVLQIFRGNQQTFAFNLFNITNRYLSIGVAVLLIIYVYKDVTAVFVGTIYVEASIMLIALVYLHRRRLLGWTKPNSIEIRRAIRFGMPLVFADLMVSLVASSDRFAIQYFLGADSVATYSVAYDISDYVAIMFASPLQLAIMPIVYSLWSNKGVEATREFLSKAINLSFIVVIPMIAGFSVVGPDLVTILASDKYADSADLVPFIAFGVMLGSIHFLLFTGLLLREKTQVITVLNGTAAITNLALNIAMIPWFGIIGAAYATIITYVLLNVITYFLSRRYLKVSINWALILKATITAATMALALLYLEDLTGYRVVDVLIRTMIGIVIYFGTLYLIESRVRDLAREAIRKLSS